MQRTMIVGGIILILLGVAVLVFGLSDPEGGFVGQVVQAIVCQNGETVAVDQIHRVFEGGVSLEFYCQLEPQLRRDVTAQATIILLIAFLIPFLSGMGLMIWAATKWQRQMVAYVEKSIASDASMFQPMQTSAKSEDTALAEKLRQLNVAYEQGLINQKEYDKARQLILENWGQ